MLLLLQLRLVLSPPLGRIPDSESMLKYMSNLLWSHLGNFRIAQYDCNLTDEAETGVEAEGTGLSQSFHHREECGGNDYVHAPGR